MAKSHKVTFKKSGVTIDVTEDEYILEEAEDAGMRLPYDCRSGTCTASASSSSSRARWTRISPSPWTTTKSSAAGASSASAVRERTAYSTLDQKLAGAKIRNHCS